MENETKEKTTSGEMVGNKDTAIIAQPEPNVIRTFDAEALISKAIEKKVPIETMERLLVMRRELKAEWAKEQFDADMAGFQGECPVIGKNKMAKDEANGRSLYKYAPLDSIVEQVKDLLQKYGFSYAFKTINSPETVKVTCIAKHRDGHSEESTMETSLATRTRMMSSPQQTASTVTFNKRYAFCNAFGIMTGDEDIDGKEIDTASPQQTASTVPNKPVAVKTTQAPAQSTQPVKPVPVTPVKPAAPVVLATANQLKLIKSLIEQKAIVVEAKLMDNLTMDQARRWIDKLLKLPNKPAARAENNQVKRAQEIFNGELVIDREDLPQ